jgi:hypothetical protein
MAIISYYVGLLAWSILLILSNFLSVERAARISRPFGFGLVCYLVLGWYLFGWKLGIANIFILLVAGNLLDMPVERLVKRFFPHAEYRWAMSPETRRKLGRWGMKMGLARRKSR